MTTARVNVKRHEDHERSEVRYDYVCQIRQSCTCLSYFTCGVSKDSRLPAYNDFAGLMNYVEFYPDTMWGWLLNFTTNHKHLKQGYGTRVLLAFQRRIVRDFPNQHIVIGLGASTEGAFLYEKCGFRFFIDDEHQTRLNKLRTMKENVKSGLWHMRGYSVFDERGQDIGWANDPRHYCFGQQTYASKMVWEYKPCSQ
jgi:hypothetical protein